jgi:hypothetical protein
MLSNFIGRSIRYADSVQLNHPLAVGLISAYRFIPPFINDSNTRDMLGRYNMSQTSRNLLYGPDGPTSGHAGRASSTQIARIESGIWNSGTYGIIADLTISMWCKFGAFPNLGCITDTTNANTSLRVGTGAPSTNAARVFCWNVDSGAIALNQTLVTGVWYRIAYASDGGGAISIWINGKLAGTDSITPAAPGSAQAIDFANNTSGGANNMNGVVGDILVWNRKQPDSMMAMEYEEALQGFPTLMPKTYLWRVGPSVDPSITAEGSSPGTITLTAPTANAFVSTNDTGTGTSPGTITLTAPTATASTSATATASTPGAITLTAPTASIPDATAFAEGITIYLFAPTAHPYGPTPPVNYQDSQYWGRLARGEYLQVQWQLLDQPDDVPTVDFWLDGTTNVLSIQLPVLDPTRNIFGYTQLLDGNFEDGQYGAVIRFTVGTVAYASVAYFEVMGGVGTAPVIGLLEIDRPLGRAIVSHEADGDVKLGYKPQIVR